MGIFGVRKEGPPLEFPEGYDKRLDGGDGDESSWTPQEKLTAAVNARREIIPVNPFEQGDVDASKLSDAEYYDLLLPTLK